MKKIKLGIIGVNGSGKTSLFRMITGDLDPSSGSVIRAKDKSLAVLTQDTAFTDADEEITPLARMYTVFSDLIRMEEEIRHLEKEISSRTGEALESAMSRYSLLTERFEQAGFTVERYGCLTVLAAPA